MQVKDVELMSICLLMSFWEQTYVEQIFLNDCVHHNRDQEVEEDNTKVFDTIGVINHF